MADKEIGGAIDAAEVVTSRVGNGSDESIPPLVVTDPITLQDEPVPDRDERSCEFDRERSSVGARPPAFRAIFSQKDAAMSVGQKTPPRERPRPGRARSRAASAAGCRVRG